MNTKGFCNIPKSQIDPFYRYKRNILQIQNRKGNTISIININIICQQINRSINDIKKWFENKINSL